MRSFDRANVRAVSGEPEGIRPIDTHSDTAMEHTGPRGLTALRATERSPTGSRAISFLPAAASTAAGGIRGVVRWSELPAPARRLRSQSLTIAH
uniref:Uncharacterized protein n=1 Tax=Anopheles dirus TaxID=7168 RepID=A0A182NWZ1_9DIPT